MELTVGGRDLSVGVELARVFDRGKAWYQSRREALEAIRAETRRNIDRLLADLRADARRITGGDEAVDGLWRAAADYVTWFSWTVEDVLCPGVALEVPMSLLARRAAACHLVYQAGRILDDAVDGHRDYKGLRPTLLAARGDGLSDGHVEPVAETTLAGVAVLLRGIGAFGVASTPVARLCRLAETACLGAIWELHVEDGARDRYDALVRVKTSAHNLIILQPLEGLVDPSLVEPLRDFSLRSSHLGQLLNDAVDRNDDRRSHRPNFWVEGAARRNGSPPSTTEEMRRLLLEELNALSGLVHDLPEPLPGPCAAKVTTFVHHLADRI